MNTHSPECLAPAGVSSRNRVAHHPLDSGGETLSADELNNLRELRKRLASVVELLDRIAPEQEQEPVLPTDTVASLLVDGRCSCITAHALARYRERTGSQKPLASILNNISRMMATAEEWELKPKFLILEALAHGQHSRFFKSNQFLFVVEEGAIVTMHTGTAGRWRKKI